MDNTIIAFWRVTDDYGELCQWYNSHFIFNAALVETFPDKIRVSPVLTDSFINHMSGVYVCAEQFMMRGKAILFGDYEISEKIMKSKSAKTHKSLGRKVKNFDEDIWNNTCYDIVSIGNYLKFTQNQECYDKLIDTNDAILAEGSPYDKIWGVGIKSDDPKVYDQSKWKGKNLLGQILMDIRDLL